MMDTSITDNAVQQAFAEATQKTLRAIIQAETYLNCTLPLPDIAFNIRGKTAGIFQYQKTRLSTTCQTTLTLRFNPLLLTHYPETFLREVVPHEVSHLAVHCHFGRRHRGNSIRPHGPEWQDLMRNCFQLTPKIYHDFPVKAARQHERPFEYVCGCSKHHFTARRHKNRLRGNHYFCRHCGEQLQYMGKLTEI